ncbi:MAG: N-acetylmuramoyl-L-alanine amidase [Clostridiales bacterium]|nr:N-acetylmuramoyl-L-alanine amidase [Clostridiales bacterium]MCF8021821.1 N-acetylmuramoyl-L-alanine amidase [Clostridiales bacterium]
MSDYKFIEMYLDKNSNGRPGVKIKPKALVIHWTANTDVGADAKANRNYFNNSGDYASTHYIVDDQVVIQCLPEDEMGFHVGSSYYKPDALKLLSNYPNDCTIGIEMCVNKDGDFQKTYQNTAALSTEIVNRYNWNQENLWRHYDITGKYCPRYFVNDITAREYNFSSASKGWESFQDEVLRVSEENNSSKGLFKDLQGYWAQETIERAYKLGLVSGVSEDEFAPDKFLTRAEGVVLLMRLYDEIKETGIT